jgi:hypothetical protein
MCAQVAAHIPWFHNCHLKNKIKDLGKHEWNIHHGAMFFMGTNHTIRPCECREVQASSEPGGHDSNEESIPEKLKAEES